VTLARPPIALPGRPPFGDAPERLLVGAGVAGAAALGLGAGMLGPLVALGAAGLLVFALCAWRPILGTYLYIGTLPLIAGFGRGGEVPLLRPNELLLVVVVGGAVAGGFLRYLGGAPTRLRLRPQLDVPLAAFVLLCTVWALASMALQGVPPGSADALAVLPVCKLAALFLLVRATVVEPAQLVRCIRLIVWSAVAIAAIAILQTAGVSLVIDLLTALDPASESAVASRGTTTLGSAIATGDVILIALLLVVTCAARGLLGARERLLAGFALGAGVLAAGQFSTWIAALAAAALVLRAYPSLRRPAVKMLPVAGVAMLVGAPAFIERLAGFWDGYGVPRSWLGRWDNLSEFYVPTLLEGGRFLIGVSPNSVLPAPETWRELIYLESGYLQFLWIGGVPLLLGFAWLSVAVLGRTRELRVRADALGASASTLHVAWWLVIVLSVIDPHIFLRGTGDLLFVLLAVVAGSLADHPARRARSATP
jgi:hypothetical protein